MLFDIKEKRPHKATDCICCKYFDTKTKECKGIGKQCFLYDERTRTIIDATTGLPIKIK